MTRCAAPSLIVNALQFAEEATSNVIFDHRDVMTDSDRGEILRALSDHIIACDVIATALRRETVDG